MTIDERRAVYGTTIREQRELRSMKQAELATLIGVTRSTISRYELGQVDVPELAQISLALAFGVNIDRLFPLMRVDDLARSA